jgi:hypothetical protein
MSMKTWAGDRLKKLGKRLSPEPASATAREWEVVGFALRHVDEKLTDAEKRLKTAVSGLGQTDLKPELALLGEQLEDLAGQAGDLHARAEVKRNLAER